MDKYEQQMIKYEREVLNILQPLGVSSLSEWHEIVYDGKKDWEVLQEAPAGYETLELAMRGIDDGCEATEYLFQKENSFVVFQSGSIVDGWGEDTELPEVFDNLETAKEIFNLRIAENEKPIITQIHEAKNTLPYDPDDVYIKPWSSVEGTFRVYYKRLMVLDHMYGINPDLIHEAIQRLLGFEKKRNIKVIELYKKPRVWNSNQRYYTISWYDESDGENDAAKYYVHVPSRMQYSTIMPISLVEKALEEKPQWLLKSVEKER